MGWEGAPPTYEKGAPPPYQETTCSNHRTSVFQNIRPHRSTGNTGDVKTFFRFFVGPVPKHSPATQYQNLKKLEPNFPNLVFCASCKATHERPTDENCFEIGGPSCLANSASQRIRLGGCRSLTWWQVHLAMRAERLSPEYGVSLCKEVTKWVGLIPSFKAF